MQKSPLHALAALAAFAVAIAPAVAAEPEYANGKAKALIEEMIVAHGGEEAYHNAAGFSFSFMTKVIGNGSAPFISNERTDLKTGRKRVEFPRWKAVIGYDGVEVWSQNWPMPLPPGFFTGLTSSFVTLPWLTQRDDANIGAPRLGAMPGHDELYHMVKLTFDAPGPYIPGQYYELFIDRESKLLEGVGFNITHPAMARVASQPIGPNFHRFLEYKDVGGLKIPSYYITHGYNAANGGVVEAMHVLYDIRLDGAPSAAETSRPEGAQLDRATMKWWGKE